MCLFYGIIIMLSVYQEVNDPYLGYDKNLVTVKRSVARCTIPKWLWTVVLWAAISCLSTEFEISASELRTLLSDQHIAGAERKTSEPELKRSAQELKISAQKQDRSQH